MSLAVVVLAGCPTDPPKKKTDAKVVFTAQPHQVVVGALLAPAVVVSVVDSAGKPVSGTQHITLALENAAGATLSGMVSVATVGGLATFADLRVTAAATDARLKATTDSPAGVDAAQSDAFDVIPQAAPTGLTALALGPTVVQLDWAAPSQPVQSVRIRRAISGGTPAMLSDESGTTVRFTDSTAVANTSYDYTITGIAADGSESAPIGPATVVTPPTAPTLTADAVDSAEDTAFPSPLHISAQDAAPETDSVTIFGLPAEFAASAGTSSTDGLVIDAAELATLTLTPPANWSGHVDLSATVTRTGRSGLTATSDPATIAITIDPLPDTPTLVTTPATGDEDTAIPLSITAGLVDVDGSETLSIVLSGVPTGAVLSAGTARGGGAFDLTPEELVGLTLTPPLNSTQAIVLTIVATATEQATQASATQSADITVTVTPVDDAPVAVPDTFTTAEDTPLNIRATALLSNDSDIDGPSVSVLSVANATGGTASLVGTSVTFTPELNFNGDAGFDYTIGDGTLTATAHVTVQVTAVDDAPVAVSDALTTDEDVPLAFVSETLTTNDTDVDGPSLFVSSVSAPTHGTVDLTAGLITFTPDANYNGAASFDYIVSDGTLTSTGHVSIAINAVDDAPTPRDDAFAGVEDTPLLMGVSAVLVNDTDLDGPSISLVAVSNPLPGTVSLSDNQISFMPDADFNGAAGFDYTVSDGTLQATAHVTLQLAPVNDAPRPVEDLLSTDEDTTLTVATDALVANDIDVEGSPLTILSVSSPSHGSVQLTSGTVRFVPDPDYFGPAGFQYVVSDGVLTAVAHVGITVVPVNDPPVAGNDGFTDSEDTALSVEAAELLANDSDIEGDQLSVVAVQNGLNGDVSLSGTTVVFVPAANFNGAAGFDYVVSDGALTAVGHVFVSVLPVNDPPVAVDDALTTNEDSSVQFTQATLLANDSDVDGPSISVTSTTNAQHGTVTMSGVRITFAPDPDFFGEAGFDYVVSDGSLSTTAHVVVTVLPVNDPPIAVDDTLSTPEDTALVVPGSTLVSNDTDIDSPVLFVASVSNPLHGAVSLLDGVVTFLPEANFNGAASFDYVVSDGALTDAGHVSVTVEPVNDAPVAVDDAFTLNEDETLTLAGTQLLANDFDIDSPTLTVLSVQDAVNGAVALAGQSITFTPDANFNGTATFTYTITDGALTGTATVTLTVLPVDDAPVAVDDAVTTDEDQPLPVATDTLVANDTDIDGPALSVTAVASPENGTVTLVDGVVTFTPDPDFNGTGAFTYTVSDGSLTAQGTVTVTVVPVNDPPVAVDDSRFVDEDTALTFAASELTLNDTDVDSLVLTVVAAGNPAHGTVALSDGLISFLPEANFNGTAGFDYTVSDGALTATAHVAVTVLPVDDAPVGVDDTLSTDEDVPLSIDAAILLANDTDIDGPALSVTAVSSPLHCTVALSNSTVTITPDADFNGAAEFDYTLSDGTLTSTAHVTVTVVPVDDAPVPAADSATTAEDTPLSLLPATLLANDTDIDGPALSLTAVAGATNGTVSLQSGNVVFTPAADFNGTAGFDYTVSDGTLTALGHVTVTVTPVNDAPVGVADSATTAEDAALVVQGSVLVANDVDIDGPALSVTAVSGATNGVVSLVGNTITFTPDANFNGSAGFDYTVSDGALTGTAHVTVTVTPVDDAPIAVADSATIAEDTSFIALGSVLTSNDTDIDGPSLTVTAVSNAVNGIVSLGSGSITFTPTLNFNGTAGFDYTVSDGTLTAVGHVTVTVTPVNDAPTVVADTITTPEDTAAVINDATLLSNDSDVDSPSITLTGVSSPTNGTVVLSAGVITFTPTANFNGTAGFDYTVSDGTLSTTGHVTVTVTAVDDPPVAVNDSRTTNEDVALVISSASLTANDTDIDGPSLTVTAVSNATNGTVSLSSGTITFTPALNFNGTAGFDYSLSDGTFTVTGHVTVTVTAVNDPPVGVADSVTTPEDTAVAVAATTLLANDTDVDSGSLTLTAVSAPTNGTVSLSSGTVTFTPSANFNGTAGFNYTVSDGAATGTGHVTVTVFAVNDAPVAVNDTASISTNGTLILSASTLMANDSDVDSIITVVSVSNSVNGTVSLSGTTITFTPTIGFTGTASFQYTISDGSLTATATVTVTVSGCVLGTDTDGDRLDDCYETGTGVYVSFTDTGTSKTNADTDGDGIKDGDEVLGTTGGLDLPSLGANPLRKDLFLEYDWFTDAIGCASHSHQPTAAAIARVTAAFAAAPVSNPDGTTGITMHNDYGQGAPFTGGNFVSDADGVLTSGVNSTEFNNIKTANFATNRRGYFHYVVLPHNYNTNSTSSGQAELPGNDLVVSLQCFTSTVNVGNTIMHELGHNLNLRHGGNSDCNYKPNYNSVMNYKFQFPGIDTNCDSSGDGTLSYSVGSRISLTESNLNEGLGVCGTTSINWNGTNGIESSISFDVNSSDTSEASACGGTLTTLTDYNDWANLSLSGGLNDADGASANPQLLASVPSEVVDCDNPAPPDLPDTP